MKIWNASAKSSSATDRDLPVRLIAPAMAGGYGAGPGVAPASGEYKSSRFGMNPPASTVEVRRDVARELAATFGVPPVLQVPHPGGSVLASLLFKGAFLKKSSFLGGRVRSLVARDRFTRNRQISRRHVQALNSAARRR